MKTSLLFTTLTALLLTHGSGAQTGTYYVDARQTQNDSGQLALASARQQKGYWRLHTDADVRATRVRFYDADHRLLYEETLSNQFVRLTERNVARLDDICDRLTSGRLVASALPLTDLTDAPTVTMLAVRAEAAHMAAVPTETNRKGYAILPHTYYQANLNRLLLSLSNPDRHRLDITLHSEQKSLEMYFETTNAREFGRKLNLVGLPEGRYTLTIRSTDRNFVYKRPFDIRH